MDKGSVIIPKVWRSEVTSLVMFVVLSVVSVILSRKFPGSVLRGDIISIGSFKASLALPLFWLLPMAAVVTAIIRIYNVHYKMDARGIEAVDGILSLNKRVMRIRFEDIRSVETDQSVLDRILDIGSVYIGTAATGGIEVSMDGVSTPKEIQEMIQRERESRIQVDNQAPEAPAPAPVSASV